MDSLVIQPSSDHDPGEKRRYTYDEYVAEFPETNQPMELWDGQVVMSPSPNLQHQRIVLRFYRKLHAWVTERDLGEVIAAPIDMVLSPHRAVQPDVVFVTASRSGILQDRIRGAADLVAEIVSLGGRNRDRVEKKDLYEQYGVREYWLIDPEAGTVEVFALRGSHFELICRAGHTEIARSELLPGFELSGEEVFAGKIGN